MGKWLFNIFVIPLLYLISILPFWLLYRLSDVLFVIAYVLLGYRKKVVTQNLSNSFPQKSASEIAAIRLRFYRQFCDIIVETVKLLSISEKNFKSRCRMSDEAQQNFSRYLKQNKMVVGIGGHCGNWEWSGVALQVYFGGQSTSTYHPLSNKNMDAFIHKLRSRFGGSLVPMNLLYKSLLAIKQKNQGTIIGLVADQTPPPESAYWTNFLNQETPVFNGPEKLARKFNASAVYLKMERIRRGYYKIETALLTEEPLKLKEGELSELHVKELEKNIVALPFSWLWSHRRWKHKKPL